MDGETTCLGMRDEMRKLEERVAVLSAVQRTLQEIRNQGTVADAGRRSDARLMREMYTILREMRERGATPLLAVDNFVSDPDLDVADQIAERGIGGPWYKRVGGDGSNFQMVCTGTLFCPHHPQIRERAPAAPRRGVQVVCRECGESCVYKPCGRTLLVQNVGGMCTVTATRAHAEGEPYAN